MPAHAQRLIDTAGSPPPDALAATRLAAAMVRELYDGGREVRFALTPGGSRVAVLLCDTDGAVLSRLSPVEALGIAAGDRLRAGLRS